MASWKNKVVLITGGSSGLGLALATAFGSHGATVVITGRDEAKLKLAGFELTSSGIDAHRIAADVTKQEDVDRTMSEVIARYKRLDVLINNAGRSNRGEAYKTSVDEFCELIELNFLSLVRSTQSALPHLLESKGHLINIGSLAAKTGAPHLGAYPASKFPVAAYSQQLRFELQPKGLHVLLVCPGPIALKKIGELYQREAAAKNLPASAGQPGAGVNLKGLNPEKLGEAVVRACEKRRPELILPRRVRWLFAISQLWPRIGDAIIRSQMKK